MVKDPKTGFLYTDPSNSPEQGGLDMGNNHGSRDRAYAVRRTIAAAKALNIDGESAARRLADMRKQIAPLQIGRHGQLQEWMEDVDDPKNQTLLFFAPVGGVSGE